VYSAALINHLSTGIFMQPENASPAAANPATPAVSATQKVTGAGAWSADFVVAQAPAMPSERMQARAELVQMATNCGSY